MAWAAFIFLMCAAWTRATDGCDRMVTKGKDMGHAVVWDLQHNTTLHTLQHDKPVISAAIDPIKGQIVTVTSSGFNESTVTLWSVSGTKAHEFPGEFLPGIVDNEEWINAPIAATQIFAGESLLTIGLNLKVVSVWSIGNFKRRCSFTSKDNFRMASFDPFGKYVLTVAKTPKVQGDGANDQVTVWDVASCKMLYRIKDTGNFISSRTSVLGFDGTGDRLWVVTHGPSVSEDEYLCDGNITAYEAKTGKPVSPTYRLGKTQTDDFLLLLSAQGGTAAVLHSSAGPVKGTDIFGPDGGRLQQLQTRAVDLDDAGSHVLTESFEVYNATSGKKTGSLHRGSRTSLVGFIHGASRVVETTTLKNNVAYQEVRSVATDQVLAVAEGDLFAYATMSECPAQQVLV